MICMFYPTRTIYLMDDLILVAGRAFSFFNKTKDYLTAVKLSVYSFPDDDFGC